jgi:hypothetical protein
MYSPQLKFKKCKVPTPFTFIETKLTIGVVSTVLRGTNVKNR